MRRLDVSRMLILAQAEQDKTSTRQARRLLRYPDNDGKLQKSSARRDERPLYVSPKTLVLSGRLIGHHQDKLR